MLYICLPTLSMWSIEAVFLHFVALKLLYLRYDNTYSYTLQEKPLQDILYGYKTYAFRTTDVTTPYNRHYIMTCQAPHIRSWVDGTQTMIMKYTVYKRCHVAIHSEGTVKLSSTEYGLIQLDIQCNVLCIQQNRTRTTEQSTSTCTAKHSAMKLTQKRNKILHIREFDTRTAL